MVDWKLQTDRKVRLSPCNRNKFLNCFKIQVPFQRRYIRSKGNTDFGGNMRFPDQRDFITQRLQMMYNAQCAFIGTSMVRVSRYVQAIHQYIDYGG